MSGLSVERQSAARRIRQVALLLIAGGMIASTRSDSAEPGARLPVQSVSRVHRTTSGAVPNNDAHLNCEHEDWRTKQWDECRWGGRLHARSQAYSNEKEAWHLYIRGVGPAIHERPVARPYW